MTTLLRATAVLAFAFAATTASAAVMTFDSLPIDFSAVSLHVEDGITLAGENGNHFHTVAGGAGTAAGFYNSDAFPMLLTFGGSPFDLVSIDFLSFSDTIGAVLTSSSGAIVNVSNVGTFNFGAGFSAINWVSITSSNGGSDLDFVLDNITGNAVPEPASWAMLIAGFGLTGAAMRRRRVVVA